MEPDTPKRRSRAPRPPPGSDELDAPVQSGHPPSMLDGRPNPEHYRSRLSAVNRLMEDAIGTHDRIPFNYEAAIKGIMFEAKMAGVDPDSLADRRTDKDKVADAILRYAQTPDVILEETDGVLEAVKAAMDRADEYVGDHLTVEFETISKKAASLSERIGKVLRLRQRARMEVPPPEGAKYTEVEEHVLRAAHLLRFMVYVGRSNIPSERADGTVFKIGRHHAKIAWDIYEARRGIMLKSDEASNVVMEGEIKYRGIVVVAPPGHGKSELACHFTALEICRNPETQAIMLHAIAEKAEGNLRYVASCFDRDNEVGRRCMSLFDVELEMSNAKKMRVKLKRPMNQPTLEAYGFMSGRLGINTTLQVWDDIVPQSDCNEETTRKLRYERLSGTWMTRQRGENTFVLCIGTLWHYDDAVMRLINAASRAKSQRPLMFRVSKQRCGGPHDVPKFKPLWPEVVGVARLEHEYSLNPRTYMASYGSNPISESSRIVRKLRYYDPMTEGHAEFRQRAVNYLSLDPSGVNRAGNDKSALVYAACGELAVMDASGEFKESREILRIIDAREFNASQTDLVEYTRGYALNNSTHYVLAEQQGQAAIVDIFREFYGVDVIPMVPGNKNKEVRLRRIAGMIDQSQAAVGGPDAVVEFPGKVVGRDGAGNPVLGPDESLKWLYDQILDFGVATGDHALDAVTQLCFHLMPDLRPGSGTVTERVRQQVVLSADAKAKKEALEAAERVRGRTADEEDAIWFKQVQQGW